MSRNYNAGSTRTEHSARGLHFGIVAGRFNSLITERLLQGAEKTLTRHGADSEDIEVLWVPGAYELPLAVKRLAATGRCAAIVALGCVIRGGTPHFEYVAGECSSGLARVSLDYDIPVSFGVLTVDTVEQARERAGGVENKGEEAALAALEMVHVLRQIG